MLDVVFELSTLLPEVESDFCEVSNPEDDGVTCVPHEINVAPPQTVSIAKNNFFPNFEIPFILIKNLPFNNTIIP